MHIGRIQYRSLLPWFCLLVVLGPRADLAWSDPVGFDPVGADRGLALLPDNTVGFVWIRNVEDADKKISAFLQRFDVSLPSPLKFLKFATGLSAGIDSGSDLLVALLPPEEGSRGYQPIVLLPVDDYGKLAATVRGDASGEICRITISGEDVLIAHNHSHALLMNVEHRATMVRLLAREPKLLESVHPLSTWLVDNDLAAVVSPTGMKALFALGRQGLEQSQQHFEQTIEQVPMEELVAQIQQTFEIYRAVLDATDAQVESSALGIAIDWQSNVKVGARLILAKTSEFAQFRFTPLDRRQLKAGSQARAYVAAVAGTMPKGWGELIAKVSRRLLQRFPDLEGYGDFKQADWDQVEHSYRATTAGVQAISLMVRVTREEEPLLSGFYGVVQVEDAPAYLASYQQALELNNELVERSTSDIKLTSEYAPVTVADATGIKVVADIASASGDQNNPFWQATMDNLLGDDGKLTMHLLAVDKSHVLVSTAVEKNLIRFMRDFQAGGQQQKSIPIGDPSLPVTLQLIEEDTPWIAIVSPRGSVQWLTRWMKALMGENLDKLPQLSPFPPTPPIGISFALEEGCFEADLVLPSETLNAIAEFVQATL